MSFTLKALVRRNPEVATAVGSSSATEAVVELAGIAGVTSANDDHRAQTISKLAGRFQDRSATPGLLD